MRDILLEVYESGGCRHHKVGDKYKFPQDLGKICPWLFASAHPMIQVLRNDGRLGWSYRGTPYEKVINKDGLTTEFVRCPDPTSSGVVLKIIAKKRKRKTKALEKVDD